MSYSGVCSSAPISRDEWSWLMHVIIILSLYLPLPLSISFCSSVRGDDLYGTAERKN